MAELQQTRGIVKIYGQVVGLENENTYREGKTKNGENYKSLSLGVKTSPTNYVYNLDLMGIELKRKVKVFSNKNGEKKQLEIDFEDRHNLPPGFTPLGFGTVRVNFDNSPKNYFNYDAVELIRNRLKEGDSIYISGEFNPNTYDANGEKRTNVRYTINGIGFLKEPINFESESFKEVSSFEQEFVVINEDLNREENKLYITGRLINYNKSWNDITFIIDANKYKDLATNFYKKTKFGDVVKVQGVIKNTVVTEEVEQQEEVDWGGETPEGIGKRVITNRTRELEITRVVSHKPKVYNEEDFIVEEDPFGSDTGLDAAPFDANNDLQWD